MNYCLNFLLVLSVQLLFFVSFLEAHSNGNITDACYTMAPVHGDFQPSTDPCLYETVPSQTTIMQGESLTITLRNVSSYSFKGYMTMAFDISKPDEAGPIGTFSLPTDGQLLSCPDGVDNAISHKDNNSIKRNVQANWTAPADFIGSVVFKTTFVRGEEIFWVKEPSENVTVILDSSTDSTDPDTSSMASTTPTTPFSTTVESSTTTAPPTTTPTTPFSTTVESSTTTASPTTTPTPTEPPISTTPPSTTVESTTTTAPPTTPSTIVPPCGSASSLSSSWITGFFLLTLVSSTIAV